MLRRMERCLTAGSLDQVEYRGMGQLDLVSARLAMQILHGARTALEAAGLAGTAEDADHFCEMARHLHATALGICAAVRLDEGPLSEFRDVSHCIEMQLEERGMPPWDSAH